MKRRLGWARLGEAERARRQAKRGSNQSSMASLQQQYPIGLSPTLTQLLKFAFRLVA